MPHKQHSKKTIILKHGLFLPLFALTLLCSSATVSKNDKLNTADEKTSIPESLLISNAAPKEKQTEPWVPFYNYLARTIKYPAEAYKHQLQGNVIVEFILNNGKVKGLSTHNPLGSGCDAEVMKAIRVFNDFKTIPDGQYNITVAFRLNGVNTPIESTNNTVSEGYTALNPVTITGYANSSQKTPITDKEEKVYEFIAVDRMPSFPGGLPKFYEYMQKNIRYPAEALANHVQGKVFLSFIVEITGELTNIKVMRGLGKGTEEEAIRVIQNGPRWSPGYNHGQPVRVLYNIPISFNLPSSSSAVELKARPIYILDGKRVTDPASLRKITRDDIESVKVLKSEDAIALYGEEGKNGAVQITTKKKD